MKYVFMDTHLYKGWFFICHDVIPHLEESRDRCQAITNLETFVSQNYIEHALKGQSHSFPSSSILAVFDTPEQALAYLDTPDCVAFNHQLIMQALI